jgi:hypothetical protein
LVIISIADGNFLSTDRVYIKFRSDLGVLFLLVWLGLQGLISLIGCNYTGIDFILTSLSIAAGVLLL